MFPEHGFVDTITDFSGVNHDSALAKIFINPYAAVPSMHCAFAMMIGATGVMVCRHWWAKAWWAFWPMLISWVVIVTANHYWVDAALGWMVALGRRAVAQRLLARARPDAWAWRSAPAPAEAEACEPPQAEASIASRRMGPSAPPAAQQPCRARNGQELRAYARDRLIESRLTPNAISMVGLLGNLVAAALVTQRLFFLAGVAFVLGSVMDTLDGRYSRMSGKGTLFGAFLDSTLDRIEEGIVLAAVAGYFAVAGRRLRRGDVRGRRARLADGLLHPRPGRGARGRMQGRLGHAAGPRGDTFDRPDLRQGRRNRRFRTAGAGGLRDRRLDDIHHFPAGMACEKRAFRRGLRRQGDDGGDAGDV